MKAGIVIFRHTQVETLQATVNAFLKVHAPHMENLEHQLVVTPDGTIVLTLLYRAK